MADTQTRLDKGGGFHQTDFDRHALVKKVLSHFCFNRPSPTWKSFSETASLALAAPSKRATAQGTKIQARETLLERRAEREDDRERDRETG